MHIARIAYIQSIHTSQSIHRVHRINTSATCIETVHVSHALTSRVAGCTSLYISCAHVVMTCTITPSTFLRRCASLMSCPSSRKKPAFTVWGWRTYSTAHHSTHTSVQQEQHQHQHQHQHELHQSHQHPPAHPSTCSMHRGCGGAHHV